MVEGKLSQKEREDLKIKILNTSCCVKNHDGEDEVFFTETEVSNKENLEFTILY
jgi:hypothetical protein